MKKRFLCVIILVAILLPFYGQAAGNISTKALLISHIKNAAASQPDEITFYYADNLHYNIADSDWMSEVLNESGIFTAYWRYGNNKCTLYTIEYMPEHTVCTTEDQVLAALRSAKKGSVNFRVPADLYQKLIAGNFKLLYELEGKAGLENRKMSYYSSSHLFLYSDIKYAANLSQVSTINELKQLMSNYRSQKKTEYTIQCSSSLYTQLSKNEFEQLHKLEGAAGFSFRNMSYNDSKRTIHYSNIKYAANLVSVKTLAELKQSMYNYTQALETEFTIHCSPELYSQISRNDFDTVNALGSNCGIYQRNMTHRNSDNVIYFTNIEYYPGFYVARSIRLGRTGQLTGKKLTLYKEAQSILRQVNPSKYSDKVELQFALQEAIMNRVTYYKGYAAGEHDTAIGALLNGRSECDGYADAFYLLADMAGFHVHFQSGYDYKNGEGHQWNIIQHNGQWYFTDLTWCDNENDSHHMYTNIGRDMAAKAYRWDEQVMLVSLASQSSSRVSYFQREGSLFQDYKKAGTYVDKQLRSGKQRVEILVKKPAYENITTAVNKLKDAINSGTQFSYSYTDEYICLVFRPYK